MNATQGLALRFPPAKKFCNSASGGAGREISFALQVAFEGFSVTQQARGRQRKRVGQVFLGFDRLRTAVGGGKLFNYDRKKLIVSFAGEKTLSYLQLLALHEL